MKDCYSSSLKLLVRRDYSTYKITQKLLEKGYPHDEVEKTLEKLKSQNYLNDQNYLEGRVRHYARNKKGPHYILQKCEEERLSVTEEFIYQTYKELGLTIPQMIREHIAKKLLFHNIQIQELDREKRFKLYSKLSRHLLSKGYIVKNIEQYLAKESNDGSEDNS